MNKFIFLKLLSALSFSGAVFEILTQEFIVGYSLLVLGYCLLRRSDEEK